jgi:hypothetical protein
LPSNSSDSTPLDFFWEFVKDMVYSKKVQNVNELHDRLSDVQIALPMKCLPVPVKKLNTALMCVMPPRVLILRSTEHIRNFARSSI